MHETELIIDLFAGGGGASCGIKQALGRDPDIAINHDVVAISMHAANHPGTRHYQQDVWTVLPRQATGGRPVGLLWASPDCTHFSKAKGGPPIRDCKRRDLAWVVVRWAEEVRPRVIILENVEEFQTWGPLDCNSKVIESQKGATFRSWVKRLRRLEYTVEFQCLRACDYGAPTSRKRLFMIARCDGLPIIWPAPTHGDPKSYEVRSGQLLPWRTAAEIIDWSIPCPSIFERRKPLAENTFKRIAEGIRRYVLEAAEPFIVTYYGPKRDGDFRGRGIDEPIPTQSTENRFGLVVPTLMTNTTHHAPASVEEPIPTLTTGNQQCLVTSKLVKESDGSSTPNLVRENADGGLYIFDPWRTEPIGKSGPENDMVTPYLARIGQTGGNGKYCNSPEEPISTITSKAEHLLCVPHLQRQFGNSVGNPVDDPVGTITAGFGGKTALVTAFMAQHNGGVVGHEMLEPVSTLTHRCTQQQVVTSHLVKFKGTSKDGQDLRAPLHTVQAGGLHYGEVRAFLTKYYGEGVGSSCSSPVGTLTSKDRMGLVTIMIEGEPHVILDIGMRMLTPRELFLAQGFPSDYKIDVQVPGKIIPNSAQLKMSEDVRQKLEELSSRPITKSDQVRMCGNSVPPPDAKALVMANMRVQEGAVQMKRQREMF